MSELPAEAVPLLALRQNESILNAWFQPATYDVTMAGKLVPFWGGTTEWLVLTNFRVIFVNQNGTRTRFGSRTNRANYALTYQVTAALDLRAVPPPRLKDLQRILIGSHEFSPFEGPAEGVADEISYARGRLIPADDPTTATPGPATERQVIIKEVVKVRCRYCGSLSLESDPKCTVCGAPVGGR